MWRRLSTQLHRFSASNISSPSRSPSPSPSPFGPSTVLFSCPFASNYGAKAAGSFNHHGMQYSTIVPNDPDVHEDFRPTNKLESSSLSLKNIVEQDVNDNPVMLYMKGVPDLPRCGFSSLAMFLLSARNVLEDPELKNAVKAYSTWPTFPQKFIKREFIGGSDIIFNMHQTGELKKA